jgi:signal transduction histidine kinase
VFTGTVQQNLPLALFAIEGALISWMTDRLRAANAALGARNQELKKLTVALASAEERERERLAKLLHDDLQQLLVGAKYSVNALGDERRTKTEQEIVQRVDDALGEALKMSRLLTSELVLPVGPETPLAEAVARLAEQMKSLHGLDVHVAEEPHGQIESGEVMTLVLRGVRELLFNVVKHAKVKEAAVSIGQAGEAQVKIIVSDDGVGCDPGSVGASPGACGGFGLFTMRQQIGVVGGQMEIDSAPGRGCRVTVVAPVRVQME